MEYHGTFSSNIYPEGYIKGDIDLILIPEHDPNDPDSQEIKIAFLYTGEYANGTLLELRKVVDNSLENFWIDVHENMRMKIGIIHSDFHGIKAEYTTDNPFDNGLIKVYQYNLPER